jgi:hypothetical protein
MTGNSSKPWGNFSLSVDEDLDVEVQATEVANIIT